MTLQPEVLVGIVTAVAALGGVVVSQVLAMLQARVEQRYVWRALLRQKLELLAQHLNDSLVWATRTTSSFVSDSPDHGKDPGDPIAARQLYTLCLLFFGPLKPDANEHLQASLNLLGALQAAQRGDGSKLAAASAAMNKSRAALDEAIEKYAAEHLPP